MSRIPEGECDDEESTRRWALQRANTARQIKSKGGQAFLRELLAALEALPSKRLIEGAIAKGDTVCALGALALQRRVAAGEDRQAVLAELASHNVDPNHIDFDGEYIWDWAVDALAAPSMIAWEIPAENDDDGREFVASAWSEETSEDGRIREEVTNLWREITPEARYERMVRWLRAHLKEAT